MNCEERPFSEFELSLIKKGFVNSFETRGSEIKISFFTKFVKEIN
jgi:hypothetical protein